MDTATVSAILHALEATEANLEKLERVWSAMVEKIPQGIAFGADAEYDECSRLYTDITGSLPAIDGWTIPNSTMDLDAIAQNRLDAQEIGEIEAAVSTENSVQQPSRDIAEYKYRLRKKRRELVRDLVEELVREFDAQLATLLSLRRVEARADNPAPGDLVEGLRLALGRIDMLLGSLVKRPERWGDLKRHLSFGLWCDVADIERLDWPNVRPVLLGGLYAPNEPLPMPVADLGSLQTLPKDSPVPNALRFDLLGADDFERLLFVLVSSEQGYENPQLLMQTNAPDRGRDVSVERVISDSLGGTRRERVIIQCKNWRDKTVGVAELATLKEQVKLWEPPRISVLVIATTGRFSADAVSAVERHNAADSALRVEMWPDSHLELLLSRRPALIAEFGLRLP